MRGFDYKLMMINLEAIL